MYPQIAANTPDDEVVRILARQVGELMGGKSDRFKSAMSTVLRYRYNGRHLNKYRKVASYLGHCKKHPRFEQLELSVGA